MKAKLMTLPNFQRGGAWPPSVRTARRSVKSDNERDPCLQLLSSPLGESTLKGPLVLNQRKEGATVGQYAPNLPGYTRATKGRTMSFNTER